MYIETEHFFFRINKQWRSSTDYRKHAFRASYGVIRDCKKLELGFELFLEWDYPSEEETIKDAEKWLKEKAGKMCGELQEVRLTWISLK